MFSVVSYYGQQNMSLELIYMVFEKHMQKVSNIPKASSTTPKTSITLWSAVAIGEVCRV